MSKITQEMIEASYKYGKMCAIGDISDADAIKNIIAETNMNESSAKFSINNMKCWLKEKDYFHSMSANETIWKLDKIEVDYGFDKLLRVINIVERNINSKRSVNKRIREYIDNVRRRVGDQ